jgi:hypothetical protein
MRNLLLLVLAACATGTPQPAPRLGEQDVMVVEYVVEPVRPVWWHASKWYDQFTDTGTPYRVVVSGEWACPQDTGTVDDPKPGQAFRCPGGWRHPRHHG